MVLVPGRGLVERDEGVVARRRVDEAGEGLLEGVVLRGGLGEREALAVGGEGGLGVVEEARPDGVGRVVVVDVLRLVEQVDAGWRGSLGAVLEEDLGERVGQVGREVQGPGVERVFARVEAHAGRGLEAPGAEVQRVAQGGEGRGREAAGLEGGEESARVEEPPLPVSSVG